MLLQGHKTVLGFNEPNHHGQSNIDPKTAAHAWLKLQATYTDKVLVGPSPAPGGQMDTEHWFDEFFKHCHNRRVDYIGQFRFNFSFQLYLTTFIATHSYSGNAEYDQRFLEKLHKR